MLCSFFLPFYFVVVIVRQSKFTRMLMNLINFTKLLPLLKTVKVLPYAIERIKEAS